ncbi:prepilin-type N-terminal cleavage/methylation domain-containing protein [Clostridium sp. A1-XYC3]|uniref:Prepilin-type N-terminal cleavage/methylation domain-containing protein n=1 Tax=Clostridium tanneri TaxID=3037988 RepID=A0ABU4JX57_9CLOT|nr:prepilin-type N-terminal cleavage/methylation domain-containing protein [Clostridium sp. A1-XYC3]MDW8802735.1 prepilin-type N-terminal cleavage/methylation domain-containing protein [Clostridium sp. A1-XYC3]
MRFKHKKGFTLVELLVVIAIIAILAAVVAPNAFKAIEKSKVSRLVGDCKAVEAATLHYYGDTGQWPRIIGTGQTNKETYLKAPSESGITGVNGWNGPYLERWPKNPFNSGGEESEFNYQLDYRKIGSNNNNLVLEISLNGVSNSKGIADMLDKTIDNTDGASKGKIQWQGSNTSWVTWTIVENAENVKRGTGAGSNMAEGHD